ncbi:MAG: hypothetical protein K0U84_08750 [Actinomycetia bacterium]|nr:hypothetical protein [Actinomycetes bacterium]
MGVLNSDAARLLGAAGTLDRIKADTLTALGRFVGTNTDLTGSGFIGVAAGASLKTTEETASVGRNVTARFDQVINAMRAGAAEYQRIEEENQATLGSVATQA